ncbi:MAG: hypothetical protein ACI379_12900 [Nocardioides sp.]|uniref:hypothetical protein n=1 Tax=Nocardioides sp. TaxID=35761 RepID=UPI003F041932
MSVKNLFWAILIGLFVALAFCTVSGSDAAKETVGWLFVVANAAGAFAAWHLSGRSDGLIKDFTRLLSFGLIALSGCYLSYRIFPLADAPAFGDALWVCAYAMFFVAGIKGTMVLADLTFRDGRRDIWISIGIGLLITVLMHFFVGLPALADDATDGQVATYQAGLLMMAVAMSTGAIYMILAYRSAGGQYASPLIFSMGFMLLAGIADFVYGMIHPAIASGISPASTLVPQADVSDWIRMASQAMIFLLVIKQLRDLDKEEAAAAAPAAV